MATFSQTSVGVTLQYPSGEPAAGATITAKLNAADVQDRAGFVVPHDAKADADGQGHASLSLWPNTQGYAGTSYTIRVRDTDGRTLMSGTIVVPNEDSARLSDLWETKPDDAIALTQRLVDRVQEDMTRAEAAQKATASNLEQTTADRKSASSSASAASDSADAASDSASAAQQSEISTNESEQIAKQKAQQATSARDSAKRALRNTEDARDSTLDARDTATENATRAENRANAADADADASRASSSASSASNSASAAGDSATKAGSRAERAESQAELATSKANAAKQSANSADSAAGNAGDSADRAKTQADRSKKQADRSETQADRAASEVENTLAKYGIGGNAKTRRTSAFNIDQLRNATAEYSILDDAGVTPWGQQTLYLGVQIAVHESQVYALQTVSSMNGLSLAVRDYTDSWSDWDVLLDNGLVPPGKVPDYDASHITSGVFDPARIPNLDAAKIATGVLAVARIPELPAGRITSGQLAAARIPGVDASKVVTGTFAVERIPALPAKRITSGVLDKQRIPELPAGRIASGTLALERLPKLPASQVTSGKFDATRIPALDAGKIKAGKLAADRIPKLPAARIASGQLDPARIPKLDAVKIGSGTLASELIPTIPPERAGAEPAGTVSAALEDYQTAEQAQSARQSLMADHMSAADPHSQYAFGDNLVLNAAFAVADGSDLPMGWTVTNGAIREWQKGHYALSFDTSAADDAPGASHAVQYGELYDGRTLRYALDVDVSDGEPLVLQGLLSNRYTLRRPGGSARISVDHAVSVDDPASFGLTLDTRVIAETGWFSGTTGPSARYGHQAATDGRYLYVFGGRSDDDMDWWNQSSALGDFWRYDPLADSWSELTVPDDGPPVISGGVMVYHDGALYLIGGTPYRQYTVDGPNGAYAAAWCCDLSDHSWTQLADMPKAQFWMGADVIGDRIIVCGGYCDDNANDNADTQTDVYAYSITDDSWKHIGTTPYKANNPAVVRVGEKIYMHAGYDGAYLASLYVGTLNGDSISWAQLNDGPLARTTVAVADDERHDRFYVFGGNTDNGLTSNVAIYETDSGHWSSLDNPAMNPLRFLKARMVQGRFVVFGGYDGSAASNAVWQFRSFIGYSDGESITLPDGDTCPLPVPDVGTVTLARPQLAPSERFGPYTTGGPLAASVLALRSEVDALQGTTA